MQLHVLEGWNSFRAEVVPQDASEVQVTEMRRAFYAGAVHIFRLLHEGTAYRERPDAVIDDLFGEFRAYRNQIRKGSL